MSKAVAQLRTLVAALAAVVFVVSVCFSGFVWKITRNTSGVAAARRQQLTQLQTSVQRMSVVANDLGNYSQGRPELMAIFRKHGIDVKPAPPAKPAAR
ncbi:MAG: hypothetical protein WCS70_08805 [Verrucomicrobiota bacterium]